MSAKIEFSNVGRSYPARGTSKAPFHALAGVNLELPAGEFLVVVGPSGCGKSTLLDLVAGLAVPTSGAVLIDGKPVTGPGPDRSLVFQQYALFPWRTVLANLEFGLEVNGIGERARRETARRYLELVGLAEFEGRYPHELSGGMKQRVAIARSLASDPSVLMMDEPFAALDAQTRETLQIELLRIWQASQKTILFITHSIDEAIFLGQRIAVMTSRPGRIKTVIDVPASVRAGGEDARSLPEFGRLRQHVWGILRDEVRRAEEQERRAKLAAASAGFGAEGATVHG